MLRGFLVFMGFQVLVLFHRILYLDLLASGIKLPFGGLFLI